MQLAQAVKFPVNQVREFRDMARKAIYLGVALNLITTILLGISGSKLDDRMTEINIQAKELKASSSRYEQQLKEKNYKLFEFVKASDEAFDSVLMALNVTVADSSKGIFIGLLNSIINIFIVGYLMLGKKFRRALSSSEGMASDVTK